MNILLVSSVFPPLAGGPSSQTYHLAQLLHTKGHGVAVITFYEDHMPSSLEGVEIESVRFHIRFPGIDHMRIYAQITWKIWRLLQRRSFDIMHIQTGASIVALFALWIAALYHLPVVAKIPGDLVFEQLNASIQEERTHLDADRSSIKARILTTLQRFMFHRYRLIWVTNDFMQNTLIHTYGYPAGRIVRMPNYRSLGDFKGAKRTQRDDEPVHVLAALRFAPMYRVPDLVEVMSRLRHKPVRMTLAGSGFREVEQQVHQKIVELGLQDQITLTGNVNPEHIPMLMEKADILLHMAYHPWPGIIVVEAMAAGLPIVVLHVPPQDAPYDGTSYYCARSLEEAVQIVNDLIDNPVTRFQIGAANVAQAQYFDLDAHVEDFLNWYRSALKL